MFPFHSALSLVPKGTLSTVTRNTHSQKLQAQDLDTKPESVLTEPDFHSQRPDKTGLGEAEKGNWAQTGGVKAPESLTWGSGGGRRQQMRGHSTRGSA